MTKTLTGNPELVESGFDHPPINPIVLLQKWLEAAHNLNVIEPRGLVLSTVDNIGRPSSRVVLLKDCDETGVTFATGRESAKGRDLESNPWAAGTLWWRETMQQINFQGKVAQLSNDLSDAMFQARTREAQAVATVSKQSALLEDEAVLKNKVNQLIGAPGIIARPEGWHAYHLAIESIEFWHGNKDRFHQRLRYDLKDGAWYSQRLQP